jgi:DNA-directed RNA polymerase subunit beta
MYAYIDRKKKFPVTTLLRALGYSSDEEILALFDLTKEISQQEINDYIGRRLASEIVDLETGEIIAGRDATLNDQLISKINSTNILPFQVFTYTNDVDEPVIARTITKDHTRNREEALEEIYRQLRTSEAPDIDTA